MAQNDGGPAFPYLRIKMAMQGSHDGWHDPPGLVRGAGPG